MQEIYKVLIEENEYAYSGVRKIVEYIEKQYSYKLTIDERLYLLIHIKRILDEHNGESDPRKYMTPGKLAMKEIVKNKIEVCGSMNRY